MIYETKALNRAIVFASVVFMCFGTLASMSYAGEGHKQEKGQVIPGNTAPTNIPPNHRIIYGTVEGVNEATIKVNAGEVGEMTPRYLELEKLKEKADLVKEGDRLEMTVNNKNVVVDYRIANEKH